MLSFAHKINSTTKKGIKFKSVFFHFWGAGSNGKKKLVIRRLQSRLHLIDEYNLLSGFLASKLFGVGCVNRMREIWFLLENLFSFKSAV